MLRLKLTSGGRTTFYLSLVYKVLNEKTKNGVGVRQTCLVEMGAHKSRDHGKLVILIDPKFASQYENESNWPGKTKTRHGDTVR